jgi:hypothetical protein
VSSREPCNLRALPSALHILDLIFVIIYVLPLPPVPAISALRPFQIIVCLQGVQICLSTQLWSALCQLSRRILRRVLLGCSFRVQKSFRGALGQGNDFIWETRGPQACIVEELGEAEGRALIELFVGGFV